MIFSDGYSRPFDAMSLQDTASGVALWRQVADGIERGIADGRFAAGDRLPGETEIAETYRVNRHTVRRALATLAERGLVRAERGSGTYVEAPRLAYPLRSRTRSGSRRCDWPIARRYASVPFGSPRSAFLTPDGSMSACAP